VKKHGRIAVINSQEDEDFEGYTLYPENAIDDSELNKRITKHNPNLKLKDQLLISHTPPRTFSRSPSAEAMINDCSPLQIVLIYFERLDYC